MPPQTPLKPPQVCTARPMPSTRRIHDGNDLVQSTYFLPSTILSSPPYLPTSKHYLPLSRQLEAHSAKLSTLSPIQRQHLSTKLLFAKPEDPKSFCELPHQPPSPQTRNSQPPATLAFFTPQKAPAATPTLDPKRSKGADIRLHSHGPGPLARCSPRNPQWWRS